MEDTATAVEEPTSTTTTTSEPSAPSSASPQVTTDRPSIKDALTVFNEAAKQQGRKPRGAAMAQTTTPPQPDAATTQPDGTVTQTPPPTSTKGPIPFDVHSTALENARTKTRSEVETQFRTQFGPVISWAQRASEDRGGFLRTVFTEALSDPDLAPIAREIAGRALNGARQPQQPAAVTSGDAPSPDFQDANGNQFYSAKAQQARDEWLMNRVTSKILGDVQPQLQTVEELQQERQQERAQAQLKQTFATQLAEARTDWPHFASHEKEIKAAMATEPLTSGHPAEEALALLRVYNRIVGPKISQLEQDKVLATLRKNANASGLNPAATGAPSGIPKNVRAKEGGSFKNALAWAAQQQTTQG